MGYKEVMELIRKGSRPTPCNASEIKSFKRWQQRGLLVYSPDKGYYAGEKAVNLLKALNELEQSRTALLLADQRHMNAVHRVTAEEKALKVRS